MMSEVLDRSVLAVDDDPAYLSVLKLCMRTCGFRSIHTANDGLSALEYLDERRVDLIISDWNMAPMDGLELLRIVRGTPALAGTPFVLMTASLSETAWREAIELGVDDFLLKPFSLTSLRAACHLACRSTDFGVSGAPSRMRTRQRLLESRRVHPALPAAKALAPDPSNAAAEPPPDAARDAKARPTERTRWLTYYEQIMRLLALAGH
jgi:two-component system chemotaxis response regulator CheY